MREDQATSLAYRDRPISDIEALNLEHQDIVDVAALCWKWAQQYPNARDVYLRRADSIMDLSDVHREMLAARKRDSVRGAIEDMTGLELSDE